MVYDYQDRGSVSRFLHDKTGADWRPLDWEARLKIVVGAAKGIAHIHIQDGGKFVHGNIKSSNIFLNSQKYGLVANAGLAKLVEPIRRLVVRNLGQFAPEVNDTSNVSQACDVYSLGVLLLELATGRPAQHTNEEGDVVSLVRWVQLVVLEEWSDEVFDVEILRYKNVDEAIVQLLQIAMECVAFSPEGRPRMFEVVKVLEEISNGINRGEKASIQSRLEDVMEDLLPRIHHGF
ncbi:PREDICTED: probable inactive receptor kinase At4g23740 [Erythranthe guttata]|uniref:probable inactive receptor kinase At4g23740 n=1 Tax=Erythranthe guttata TaxID=4155 RepID=UPI00064DA6FD|nr:PREDICTED: probable inactive receptor kinase At4g23740 [Erythranthe guttata]|eukprot:XP_012847863.1 PREDICTED: probable inactive receptor kinase At4g23740 [Erythranthe guttata]